jgi:hypothetical protein
VGLSGRAGDRVPRILVKFEDVFEFDCGSCEEIWFMCAFSDEWIRFSHVIWCLGGVEQRGWVSRMNAVQWPE